MQQTDNITRFQKIINKTQTEQIKIPKNNNITQRRT